MATAGFLVVIGLPLLLIIYILSLGARFGRPKNNQAIKRWPQYLKADIRGLADSLTKIRPK